MTALIIILCLLGVVVLLLLVAVVRALAAKRPLPNATPPPLDEAAAAGYAQRLSRMIQYETVNTPGEGPEVLRARFEGFIAVLAGCYPRVFNQLERIELPEALLLRWRGKDSTRGAILLMAHSDVVPATGAWQYPPFSGTIADNKVWGRGTIDIKNGLCAILESAEALLGQGFVPACDVYIESSFNEESMGPGAIGARDWFVENNIPLDIVSDEGGFVTDQPMPGLAPGWYAMLGLTEKGYVNLRFTANSHGGHASTPYKGNPMARLARFICAVEKKPPFTSRISSPVKECFDALVPYMRFPTRLLLANRWLFTPYILWHYPRTSPHMAALLRTTCVFTMGTASPAPNVIPATASVTANLRPIMHQDAEASIAAMRAMAARYGLETEVLYARGVSPLSNIEAPAYAYLAQLAAALFPEAVVAPYIMLGGTDSRHFSTLCPVTLRFGPFFVSHTQHAGMHGLNEYIDIPSLARGVGFYAQLLTGWA
ncbi:MAG: M20/M25/M40 family metallo-hydrolase [Ruminococcaceae bacterium]|nr:M20/M25/M40 family metallo-hydrolase [Oscillospiraceae bacterium]